MPRPTRRGSREDRSAVARGVGGRPWHGAGVYRGRGRPGPCPGRRSAPRESRSRPEWYPLLPRIAHDGEVARCPGLVRARAPQWSPGISASSSRLLGVGPLVEPHWSLNAVNSYAVEQLVDLGANTVWLSPELSSRQITELAAGSSASLGLAVWGAQEVMVTEHCALMAEGPCTRRVWFVRAQECRAGLAGPQGIPVPGAHGPAGGEATSTTPCHSILFPRCARSWTPVWPRFGSTCRC